MAVFAAESMIRYIIVSTSYVDIAQERNIKSASILTIHQVLLWHDKDPTLCCEGIILMHVANVYLLHAIVSKDSSQLRIQLIISRKSEEGMKGSFTNV